LTAATPVLHGKLANTDVRWHVISSSVDDRTPAERGEAGASTTPVEGSAGGGVTRLAKSRYDSISTFISEEANVTPEISRYYNDVPCEVDEKVKETLVEAEIDEPIARHLAHLFTRDPLVAFEGAITEVDDQTSTEHFESLNSTNWQTMRWKPPPPSTADSPHIGWRTEFRPMEVQPTDFENAAFTAFIVLLTRVLLVFNLDILYPLSKVDENMERAHKVDAVNTSKFWFRSHIVPSEDSQSGPRPSSTKTDSFEEMTMAEIMNGKGGEADDAFPGLIPLIYAYLEHIGCDETSFARLDRYLKLIGDRASGKLMTPATWMRKFVRSHADYKQDSVVGQSIVYDLLKTCDEIGRGERECKEVLGDNPIERIRPGSAWDTSLVGGQDRARNKLLQKLRKRSLADDGPLSLPSGHRKRRCSSL